MFSIIISEKGGAERSEGFDKNEVNVGRVQGNDLVLAKGNVSKHHARLLFRDGRFIVTDLKSTNGTYVNGRKIAQATIVREGDKVYIGDYVLRLEATVEADAPAPNEAELGSAGPEVPKPPAPPVVTLKAESVPPGAPSPRPQPSSVVSAPPPPAFPVIDKSVPGADETSAMVRPPRMAPSPAAGGGSRSGTVPLSQASLQGPRVAPPAPPPPAPAAPAAAPSTRGGSPARPPEVPAAAPSSPSKVPPSMPSTRAASVPPPAAAYRTLPPRAPAKDEPGQAARRLAMTMLLGRIGEALDLTALDSTPLVADDLAAKVERVAREQAAAMREEEEAPAEVDITALARDAHRELVGLGPLAALLDDDEITEIHVARFDRIDVVRGDRAETVDGASFTSETAFRRAIERLVAQHGEPWPSGESLIERRLPRASLVAVAPPSGPNHVLSIRKRSHLEVDLEALASAGTLSPAMAQFLEACTAARVNILVSATATVASSLVLSALSALASADERVCVAQDAVDLATGAAQAVALSLDAGSIRAAAKLRPHRLVVARLTGTITSATIDAMADGASGVAAAVVAPSLRQGLSRLAAQLVLHRPALAVDGARELLAELFDIVVEVTATPDGRTRIVRIAELGGEGAKGFGLRDLFTFSDAGDGTFAPTGTVPRIAADLAARGAKLDPALFRRGR